MRMIGKGQKALNMFCGAVNVWNGMSQDSYENILELIEEKSLNFCQKSMNEAANDVRM